MQELSELPLLQHTDLSTSRIARLTGSMRGPDRVKMPLMVLMVTDPLDDQLLALGQGEDDNLLELVLERPLELALALELGLI